MTKQAAFDTLTDPAKAAPFTDLSQLSPSDIQWIHATIERWATRDEMATDVASAQARADKLAESETTIGDMADRNPALDDAWEALGIERERATRIFQCLNWAGLAWMEA